MDTSDAGRMGGNKLLKERGVEYFINLSKKAAKKRTAKAKKPINILTP